METKTQRKFFIITGVLYGIVMFGLTFLSLGAGEGTPLLFAIFSSPFSRFFGNSSLGLYLSLLLIPVIWIFFGMLTAFIEKPLARIIFLISIATHYLTMLYFLISPPYTAWREDFWGSTLNYLFSFGAPILAIGLVAYILGQFILWRRFLKSFSVKMK